MPDPVQIITALDFSSPEAAAAFQALYDTPEGAEAAVKVLATSPADDVAQAALAIYRTAGPDPAVFVPWLNQSSLTIRVIAGASAIERGEVAGFAALIGALDSDELMANMRPPGFLWRKALRALVMATGISSLGPPLDASIAVRTKARQRWSDWLETNRPTLKFDTHSGEWNA